MARAIERPKQTYRDHYSDVSSTREYGVVEASTRSEAINAVLAVAPLYDEVRGITLYYDNTELKEFGGGCWDAVVNYSKDPETIEVTFDIGAGNVKAQVSKANITIYDCINGGTNTGEVPDFKKGIGYNGKQFDGCDVEIPRLEMTINRKLKFTTLDATYITTLFSMAQTVNDSDFSFIWYPRNNVFNSGNQNYPQILTFRKGTLRFKGARIKQDSDDNLDITYMFVYSRSIVADDGFTIGNSSVIEKEGHQYLWVYFDDEEDANTLIKTPIAAYIEQVYDYSDFTQLNL